MFTNTQKNRRKLLSNQLGMTLIEILIVISLIAIIGATVGSNLFQSLEEGKISSAKIQMKSFAGILGQYKRHCYRFPTTEQGLDALISKPTGGKDCKKYQPGGYLQADADSVPLDPWDEPYVYESDGKKFTIFSVGPDLEIGTEDDVSSKD